MVTAIIISYLPSSFSSCQLEQNNVPPYLLRDNPRAGKVEKKIDGKCGKCARFPFEATEKSARFNPDFLSVLGVCQDVKSIISEQAPD